jgi:hypothetical protein
VGGVTQNLASQPDRLGLRSIDVGKLCALFINLGRPVYYMKMVARHGHSCICAELSASLSHSAVMTGPGDAQIIPFT